jgi:hypothetical protein
VRQVTCVSAKASHRFGGWDAKAFCKDAGERPGALSTTTPMLAVGAALPAYAQDRDSSSSVETASFSLKLSRSALDQLVRDQRANHHHHSKPGQEDEVRRLLERERPLYLEGA